MNKNKNCAAMEHSEESSTPREAWNVPACSLPFARMATSGSGPGERYGHSTVLCCGKLYVFGGCDVAGRFMSDLFALDLDTGVWQALPNENGGEWPMARHFHAAVTVGSSFYVLFGKSNGYMNDLHRFDPAARRWERIESHNSAPSRRYGHAAVEWGGDVYVYGGFDDFGLRCNDLWKFDCARREWSAVLHLQSEAPEALHHAAVVYQGSMLVWGGVEAASDVHEFRFGSRSWSRVQVLKRELLCFPSSQCLRAGAFHRGLAAAAQVGPPLLLLGRLPLRDWRHRCGHGPQQRVAL